MGASSDSRSRRTTRIRRLAMAPIGAQLLPFSAGTDLFQPRSRPGAGPLLAHPGIEPTYVLEGSVEIPIQGQPTRSYKQGDNYQVPAGTPHAGGKPGATKVRLATTYVVEKDKPLVSPA